MSKKVMIENIVINKNQPFIAEIPKCLSFSRELIAPYLRTYVVHFQDIDFSHRELEYAKSNDTASNGYQNFDCELIAEDNYPSDETIKFMVMPMHMNRMVTWLSDDDLASNEGDEHQTCFNCIFDHLKIDFEYTEIKNDDDQLKLAL